MNGAFRFAATLAAIFFFAVHPAAYATNGYFQIGYGAKSVGMGGAGLALAQDGMASAVNPAAMTSVQDGLDVGARLFSPRREGELTCVSFGCAGSPTTIGAESDREYFLIPSFAYTRKLNERLSFGVTLYGNGGMNTTYRRNLFVETAQAAGLPGTGGLPRDTLGVDLIQAILAPTLAWQINENHSIGASLLGGAQRFSARGLTIFGAFGLSTDPANLTNRGNDWAYGLGGRIGWQGKITNRVTLGAAYTSKVYMTEFDKYRGLFAEQGDFDVPSHYGFGIKVEPVEKLAIALDFTRINYDDVAAVHNPGPTAAEFGSPLTASPSRLLGGDNGMGFGWQSIWVMKLGLSYDLNPQWTLRAGFNHGESPIPDGSGGAQNDVLFNLLAPGVTEDHLTLGFSYRPSANAEWSLAYMYAFENTQRDASTVFLGSPARISMHQHALDIGFRWRF